MIRNNRTKAIGAIAGAVALKMEASGLELRNGIQDEIRRQGRIDSGRMINDVTYQVSATEVRVGTTIDDPNYPAFQNNGTRHITGGHFMEKGSMNSVGNLRRIWSSG